MADVESKYLHGFHYPKETNFKKAVQVYYNMIVAHTKVVCFFKKKHPNKKITIILNVTPTYPRSNNLKDQEAAKLKNMIFTYSQLDLILKGAYDENLKNFLLTNDLLPISNEKEIDYIKKSKIDYLSLNYYQPSRVKEKKHRRKVNCYLIIFMIFMIDHWRE